MPVTVYPIMNVAGGTKESKPKQLLQDVYSPDSRDLEYEQDTLKTRGGLEKEISSALSGRIMQQFLFKQFNGTQWQILFTPKDIYYHNTADSTEKYITPIYNTGKIRVENGSAKIYGGLEVDNCDDSPVVWADGSGGDVTPSRNTTSPKDGTAFVRLTVAAGAGLELLAYHDITSVDLSAYDSVGFWIRSSVNTSAGDLVFNLDDTAACASPLEAIDIPALTANTWTWVNLTLATPASLTAVISIGITQAVDIGACTIDIDQIVAGDWAGQAKAGDYIRLGGLNDASPVWYEVQTVDSDTEITVTANYAESSADQQAYTIRKVFTTETSEAWRVRQFTDGSLGDIFVATNFNDDPVYWDGTGQVVTIPNANKCKDFIVLAQRLVALHTVESGASQTQRVRWSDVADITTWGANNFEDVVDTPGKITGGDLFRDGNHAVIFKNDSKYLMTWIGGDFIFDIDLIDMHGTDAVNSIVNVPELGLFYYGNDLRFRFWNGAIDRDMSEDIISFIENIDPSNWVLIYCKYLDNKKQIRCLVPKGDVTANNFCLVLDTERFLWFPWEYKAASSMSSLGDFWNISVKYVDESPWDVRYVDEHLGFWDDQEFLENSPVLTMGGDDGYLRRVGNALNDDGTVYTPYFVSKRLDFQEPFRNKRLWKIQPIFHTQAGQTAMSARVAVGDLTSFSAAKNFDISNTLKEVEKTKFLTFNKNSDVFDVKFEGAPPWRLIGFICYLVHTKRMA